MSPNSGFLGTSFLNKVTAWFEKNSELLQQDDDLKLADTKTTRTGTPVMSSADFFALDILSLSDDYITVVEDCTRLSESNPVLSPIISKLARTVAHPRTEIEVSSSIDGEELTPNDVRAKEVLDDLLKRISWESLKETFIRRLLNEGGISWELVLNKNDQVRYLEYRPHFLIKPHTDDQGNFTSVQSAYSQYTIEGQRLATYAKWQLVDIVYVESAYHDRGIPHLQAARKTLSNVGQMLKGMMQKWSRSGTTIEHFNMKDASWAQLEKFKAENAEALDASPDNMLRQFFSAGDFKVERLTADGGAASAASDANSMELMLEIIFMAAGVSKEIMGFKSHTVIKDMAAMAFVNFYQVLTFIQKRMFEALKHVCNFQLLLDGILPEEVNYTIKGGVWKVDIPPAIQTWMTSVKDQEGMSLFSVNDIRRQAGVDASPNPDHAEIGSAIFTDSKAPGTTDEGGDGFVDETLDNLSGDKVHKLNINKK